jgi:hypothetical protein
VKVTASAGSLNAGDVAASSLFLHQHFGFAEVMAAGGFASLARHDIGRNVVDLRRGLPALPGDQRDVHATGLIFVFAVDGPQSELARPRAEGARITMPLTCEEWGGAGLPGPRPQRRHQLADWNAPTATRQPTITCSSASAGRDHERESSVMQQAVPTRDL